MPDLDNPGLARIPLDLLGEIYTTYLFLALADGDVYEANCGGEKRGYFVVWRKPRHGVRSQWLETDDQKRLIIPENLPYQPLLFAVSDVIL